MRCVMKGQSGVVVKFTWDDIISVASASIKCSKLHYNYSDIFLIALLLSLDQLLLSLTRSTDVVTEHLQHLT